MACVLCVFWAHASDFVTSRPFVMRLVWSAFEHFITCGYFTVCAYLCQPIAPREFRVCVLAHRSGAMTSFRQSKFPTASVRTTSCSAAAPLSKYYLLLLLISTLL